MMNNYLERIELESKEKWEGMIKDIPTINFDSEWGIKILPPFGGAMARFWVMKGEERIASVYLDWYDRIGYFGSPYYELYPWEDDIKRYALNETKELEEDIRTLFNKTI